MATLLLSGCGSGSAPAMLTIKLSSTSFPASAAIPKDFTGEGKDVSPALTWSNLPQNTQELALICDDPDAPSPEPWVHWVLYGIPANTTGLPEGIPAEEELKEPAGAKHGLNDFSKPGHRGPMPPPGQGPHHYHFMLYALDKKLNLEARLTKAKLLEALKGHILAQGEYIGTYERK